MPHLVRMPEVLAGAHEAAVQSWLIAVGEEVEAGAPLADIETEKAVVEYCAEQSGTLVAYLVDAGVSVEVGAPIAVLASAGESLELALEEAGTTSSTPAPSVPAEEPNGQHTAAGAPAAESATAAPAPPSPAQPAESAPASEQETEAGRRFISPLARRIARQRGIDLDRVAGSGPRGRILRRDVEAVLAAPGPVPQGGGAAERVPASAPAVSGAGAGAPFEDLAHTRMRRVIARRLLESKTTIPHFYLKAECRVDELVALRKQLAALDRGKVSFNDLVLKAAAVAYRSVPEANAIWTEEATRRFSTVDIGIAVSVEGGLFTPVIRDVDSRSVFEVAEDARRLAEEARAGTLSAAALSGGTMAVSNLGMFGIEEFTAIINPPQSGILAVGAITQRPFVDESGTIAAGHGMTVTFSADHRVMDGVLAARWLRAFVDAVEAPLSLLV